MSRLSYSFELFPPKTEKGEELLWRNVEKLKAVHPAFISVTYGAGGSTGERTHKIVTRLQNEVGIATAAHLTCVQHTKAQIAEIAGNYRAHNISHIVALRGDPPGGPDGIYIPTKGGYAFADSLVKALKALYNFEISVAGYPETHPQSGNQATDLACLKRKTDNGADRIITQFFLDTEAFLRYRDKISAMRIKVPVIPGILPITNFAKTAEFARKCGTSLPKTLWQHFEGKTPAEEAEAGTEFATEQCRILQAEGVTAFHFYTLNKAELALAVCRALQSEDQTQAFTRAVLPPGASGRSKEQAAQQAQGVNA